MVAKRVLFPKEMPQAKRLRRIERQVYRNRPEMKHRDVTLTSAALADGSINLTELTAIAQGDGVADRDGAVIRVFRVEACGRVNTSGVDVYFVTPKMNNAPTYGDFQSVTGGFCNADSFVTWYKHITDCKQNSSSQFFYKFKYPIKIHYAGSASTAGQRNRVWFVVKNDTGGAVAFEFALRIWYTDA